MGGNALNKLLKKRIPESLISELDGALSSLNGEKVRVVNTGLLKAGKSTLFNCLTESLADDLFATGSTRKTVKAQEYEFEHLLLVDTPGIDYGDEDTKSAVKALKQGDIILFVHNMNAGELDMPEREFLELIAKEWGSKKDFLDRAIFVLTNLDKKEASGSEQIVDKVKQQIHNIFGGQAKLISASSTRYSKGMRENKQLMVEKSGIPALKTVIYTKAAKISDKVLNDRKKKAGKAFDAIDNLIKSLIQKAEQNIKENDRHIEHKLIELDNDFSGLCRNIKTKLDYYNTL